MQKPVSEVLQLDLPCDRYAPGAVRAALDEIAGIDGVRDDAPLVVDRPTHQPRTPAPPGRARRGPGLQVIELLASRWTSERSDACWAWAEIDL